MTNDDTHYKKGPQQSSAPHGHAVPTIPVTPYRWCETIPILEDGQTSAWYWCKFRAPWEHRETAHVVEIQRSEAGGLSVHFLGGRFYPGSGVLKDARWSTTPVPEPAGG